MKRFIITESKHIKGFDFDAAVMDTTKPDIIDGKHYKSGDGALHYYVVCECDNLSAATHIAEVLNDREDYVESYDRESELIKSRDRHNAEIRDSLSRLQYPDTTGQ